MENPLSQADIDALMRALLPANGEDLFKSRDASIRNYDFRRPTKFSKDLLRTLVMVHDSFARLLQSFFLGSLRTRAQVNVRSTNQYSYAEFTQLLPNPAVILTYRIDPLPGFCLMEISQNIAYAIVDKIFGGAGSDLQPQRGLSEIELGVVQRMAIDMFTPLQEAWRNVADIQPVLENIETNPMFLQTAAPSEVLAAITLGVQIGEHVGHITLAFPYSMVHPVLSRLSPHSWLTTEREQDNGEQEIITESVQQATIEIRVLLGTARISVADFMVLTPGDVVILDKRANSELPVYVGNVVTFFGRPGVVRTHLAIQIKRHSDNPHRITP